jgi:hypothetical protein
MPQNAKHLRLLKDWVQEHNPSSLPNDIHYARSSTAPPLLFSAAIVLGAWPAQSLVRSEVGPWETYLPLDWVGEYASTFGQVARCLLRLALD